MPKPCKEQGKWFRVDELPGNYREIPEDQRCFPCVLFLHRKPFGRGKPFLFPFAEGVRRVLGVCLWMLSFGMFGCAQVAVSSDIEMGIDSLQVNEVMSDSLLQEANRLSNRVYEANLQGKYETAIACADSALACMNAHFMKYATFVAPMLQLVGEGTSAELEWFASRFDTDYYVLLDVRNEAAVAYLALGDLDAYRYNNQAYTSLYKQISVDVSLEDYCTRMQLSANNKIVAIMLCVALVVLLLVGYYVLYLRHRLMYRYGLEQVLEINRRALAQPSSCQDDVQAFVSPIGGYVVRWDK